MLVHKDIIKNTILNYIQKSFSSLSLNWSNIANTIGAMYIAKNKVDEYLKPFILQNENINIQDLESLFLEQIERVKKDSPSLIGANGEIFRIPIINGTFSISEQEMRDLINEIKSKVQQ